MKISEQDKQRLKEIHQSGGAKAPPYPSDTENRLFYAELIEYQRDSQKEMVYVLTEKGKGVLRER